MKIARISVLAMALAMSVPASGCSSTSASPPPSQENSSDGGGSDGSSAGATTDGGVAIGATDGGATGGGTDGAAAGSGTDGAAAGSGTDGAAAGGGTDGAAAGSGTDGAAGVDATVMGGSAEGGGAESEGGDAGGPSGPPPPAAACSQTAVWGTGTSLAIPASADAASLDGNLGAITPDELTIAWTIGNGSSAVIAYADRAAETDAFGEPQMLSAGSFADERVALSANGLRLVVVNGDHQGFSEMTRTARMGAGNTFGAPGVGSYSNFTGILATTGEAFGDPVLSADDNRFYYSIYGRPGETDTIARSIRLTPSDAWPVGTLLPATSVLAEEQEEVSLRRRPTAISSDAQTLFYWDEVSGTERATWLDTSTDTFTGFVDLGARQGANPNAACDRLYYSDPPAGTASLDGSTVLDLFVASD